MKFTSKQIARLSSSKLNKAMLTLVNLRLTKEDAADILHATRGVKGHDALVAFVDAAGINGDFNDVMYGQVALGNLTVADAEAHLQKEVACL